MPPRSLDPYMGRPVLDQVRTRSHRRSLNPYILYRVRLVRLLPIFQPENSGSTDLQMIGNPLSFITFLWCLVPERINICLACTSETSDTCSIAIQREENRSKLFTCLRFCMNQL